MTFLLPLVALALAFATLLLARTDRGKLDPARVGVLALLVAIGVGVAFKTAPSADRTPAIVGLVLGALAPVLGRLTGSLAPGVAAAAALHLFPTNAAMGLALVVGTGLGALAVGGEASALAAALVFAADDLGARHSQAPAAAFVGSQVGVALAVGAFVAPFLPKALALGRSVVVGMVTLLGGLYAARAVNEAGTLCVGLGALTGVVLHFLMPDDEGESPRVGLAAVIGVGLATVAFGLGRGAGMGLAGLGAVGVLLAVDNRRAVLTLGPLVGLVMYRVLREAGTGATRALDIAQHYTLLALILGLVFPLLPSDWLRHRRGAVGVGLWGIVTLAAAPLAIAALGVRGAIGLVVGLGTAGLVQALRAPTPRIAEGDAKAVERPEDATVRGETRESLLPLALGTSLGGSAILALTWLGDDSALARDAKVRLFAYAAVGIAIIAAMLSVAGRQKREAQ